MAKHRFRGDQLTAFFGGFYVYLNLISLVLQLFFTAWVVRRVGVGGTLQIMPVSITVASLVAAAVPRLGSAAGPRAPATPQPHTLSSPRHCGPFPSPPP